jgi:hypothetical protein
MAAAVAAVIAVLVLALVEAEDLAISIPHISLLLMPTKLVPYGLLAMEIIFLSVQWPQLLVDPVIQTMWQV